MAGCCGGDPSLWNIIILGISFMLVFAAFQTCSMVEKTVLDSVPHFGGSGYTSLAIVYVVFSLSNFAAPSVVSVFGAKISMIGSSLTYFLFVFSFLKPMVWSLYTGSVIVGLGAAIIWTAQGNCLTLNSTSETVARNSGIFWALFMSSLLIGNLYSFFVFKGKATIDNYERTHLFIALSAAALAGTLCLFLLRKRKIRPDIVELGSLQTSVSAQDTPWTAFKRSFELLKTKQMLLLSCTFFYTGVHMTFFSGVYGTSLSHNIHFGSSRNGLLGIAGIFIGVGEIFGGLIFGLLGKRTVKYGRDPIVFLGYVLNVALYFMAFIMFPEKSPIEETDAATYFASNRYVAIVGSFVCGFGDSCFNTQLLSLLGSIYTEDSAPAFALFKFVQSVAAAIAFYYSSILVLEWQLLILVVTATVGVLTFSTVEWQSTRVQRYGYVPIGSDE